MLPIGIYEKALPYNVTWRERLALAHEAGFDFVEMSVDESDERLARLDWSASERAELREAVAATGVPIITMCLSGHRKWALGSASPEIRERGLEIMRKAVRFCADTGIRTIQLAGYYVYYEPHVSESMERYQDGLAQGLEWASQAGVMLALENVDGNDVDSITKAMIFVDHFNSPWFQVYPDVGNLGEHGLDVCAELERRSRAPGGHPRQGYAAGRAATSAFRPGHRAFRGRVPQAGRDALRRPGDAGDVERRLTRRVAHHP